MATKRINNGVFTIELASGDYAVAVAQVDSTGAAATPGVVTANPATGTVTDKSLTLTTATVAQTAINSNASRKYLFIQNPSGSGASLWYSLDTTAVQASPSIELLPGASWENPAHYSITGALSLVGGVNSQKATVKEA